MMTMMERGEEYEQYYYYHDVHVVIRLKGQLQ